LERIHSLKDTNLIKLEQLMQAMATLSCGAPRY